MEGEIEGHFGAGDQLLRIKGLLETPPPPCVLSLPGLVLVPRPPPPQPSWIGRLDLGLFSVHTAGATVWQSLWEPDHDRQGLTCSLSFLVKLRDPG